MAYRIKLKKCLHCEGIELPGFIKTEGLGVTSWRAMCTCGITTIECTTKDEAARRWNNRSPSCVECVKSD